jgi:hypothetical protein
MTPLPSHPLRLPPHLSPLMWLLALPLPLLTPTPCVAVDDLPPAVTQACQPLQTQRAAIDSRLAALAPSSPQTPESLRDDLLPALRAVVSDLDALNDDAFPRCKVALLSLPAGTLSPPQRAALLYLPHLQTLAAARALLLSLDPASQQRLWPLTAALTDAIHAQVTICETELQPTQCASLRQAAAALPPLPPLSVPEP